MEADRPVIALLYDFDKTLCTDNMQDYSFIPNMGMKPDEFWDEVNAFSKENRFDAVLSYLYLMIRKSAENRRSVHREDFMRLGRDIDFFPGVDRWFETVNTYAESLGAKAEHYIISSGLKEIIEGCGIGQEFSEIYACEYYYDENGVAVWPKTAVNYTGKTQFLFRINKGVLDITNDKAINRVTPPEERRVPFANMIYLGDGMTDVPCMKLTRSYGGHSIAVYPPNAGEREREVSRQLILDNRVDFSTAADYREGSELFKLVMAIMRKIVSDSELKRLHWQQKSEAKAALAEQKA